MTNLEDYIFDTIPHNPEFDLEQLNLIQNKLQSGYALTAEEATVFLDWTTYNARSYAVSDKNVPKDISNPNIFTEPMTGQCAPTQRINVELLRRFGLDARAFNTADCMGQIPLNSETYRRMENGRESPAVRHSVSIVSIPIDDGRGNVANYKFLLDPTFRQFCLKKNCVEKEEWSLHGYGAPHTGYFMQSENLMRLGVSEEEAGKTENIGKYLIERGYLLLTEENARLYMNAFRRASIDRYNQNIPHEINGYEFISNFERIPMQMHGFNKGNEEIFTRTPSEIMEQENRKNKTIFSRIKDLFKKIFNKNNIQALPEGKFAIPTKNPYEEFREQYEFDGKEVEGINKGQAQQLDTLLKGNTEFENER